MGWTDNDEIEQTESENDDENEIQQKESMTDNVNLESLTPGAMNVQDAADQEHTWGILIWGHEGAGKSHFGYTMPEPVCFIDTENKADDIAHKFSDKVAHIWQPDNFDEAVQARDEALNYLSEYLSQTDKTGTIVVDSMDDIWTWAQHKYINKYMSNTDVEDVNLDLEDWAPIKKIHNEGFRNEIKNCDFNFLWTATRKDDLNRKIEEGMEETPDKPGGESKNKYRANSIIRLQTNPEGIPEGTLHKSGILRFKYMGLERPTFQKHKHVVQNIQDIETDGANSTEEVEELYDGEHDIYGVTEANLRYLQ